MTKLLGINTPLLALLKRKGFSMKPCMHGTFHYYVNGIGAVQVSPATKEEEVGVGHTPNGEWSWSYSNDLTEIEKSIDKAIETAEAG